MINYGFNDQGHIYGHGVLARDYLDGKLNSGILFRVDRHLEACNDCKEAMRNAASEILAQNSGETRELVERGLVVKTGLDKDCEEN